MYFSIVVPTFGRPDEVTELLNSLEKQHYIEFEVLLADGSPDDSVKRIVAQFSGKMKLKHLHKKLFGISESRNWGVENAIGDIIVFFDSDCVIPPNYLDTVQKYLSIEALDAYGGPDRADESFNNKQKAISYAMTSLYTTGGIRGRKKHAGAYQPRSFNMGIRRSVFNIVGGFSGLRVSEDIDLSLRLAKSGYRIGLIEEAFVYHKRRSTFYKFFRQVFSFGSGRIDLQLRHGDALKPVHLLPSLFVIYMATGIILFIFSMSLFRLWLITLILYSGGIMVDSAAQNKSLVTGLLSVYAAFVMLTGYGLGMIKAILFRFLLRSNKESEKPDITREA